MKARAHQQDSFDDGSPTASMCGFCSLSPNNTYSDDFHSDFAGSSSSTALVAAVQEDNANRETGDEADVSDDDANRT